MVFIDDRGYRSLGIDQMGIREVAGFLRVARRAHADIALMDILLTHAPEKDTAELAELVRGGPLIVLPRLSDINGNAYRYPEAVVEAAACEGSTATGTASSAAGRRSTATAFSAWRHKAPACRERART